jgi:prepilin-type N-terminal cleavage/methylation domain-containing protein
MSARHLRGLSARRLRSLSARRLRGANLLRDERGFTLVELLVATLAGVVISAATGAIVVVSVHLSSNFSDRVDANSQGRVAMEKITQALNSSCVSASVPPVVSSGSTLSDDKNLYFYSSLSDSPTINPNEVKISLTGGSLIMYTYSYLSGSAPNWTFSSTPTTSFVLLPHAAQATINGTANQPVFQYYGYTPGTGTLSTTAYTATTATPLSAANAATTAMVTINFEALPSNGNTAPAPGRPSDITSSVVLRLTPASSAASASNAPCS